MGTYWWKLVSRRAGAAVVRHPPAPPLIAVRGTVATLSRPTVAIVGSRNCSIAGRKLTARIAGDLGRAGCPLLGGSSHLYR